MTGFFRRPEGEYSQAVLYDEAPDALLNVITALVGAGCGRRFAEKVVIKAAGDARSPDAVSRAIRQNLSSGVIDQEFKKKHK